jgi:type I restriction enzyme R subunit
MLLLVAKTASYCDGYWPGKTKTAFQIIWRLWKSGARSAFFSCRSQHLADWKTNDFKPFGQADQDHQPHGGQSLEIIFAVSAVTELRKKNIYKQFSPDFFDLVVIDECHRGSAADDAAGARC